MKLNNPYHEGELQVQKRVGGLVEGAQNSRVIQDSIIKGALGFLNHLPMVVFGSLDQDRNVWASVFVGMTGFMQAEDDRTITFDLTRMLPSPNDPFWENIEGNRKVGMLAIDLASRRRLRINGTIAQMSGEVLKLRVEESYPNCPKYIQRRHLTTALNELHAPIVKDRGNILGENQRGIISKADTFFVASAHPERGVDASHRGGNPGFVKALNNGTLRIPDYQGNSMFNTLGNFSVNPRAGLIFLDFESNRVLQLIGKTEILYDVKDSSEETGGTNRWWQVHIDRWIETTHTPQLAWELVDYSPYNPKESDEVEN